MNRINVDTCLKNNPLSYRSILTLPQNVNFGFELELENVELKTVAKITDSSLPYNWQVKEDDSLELANNAEIASPVLQNTKETWLLIKKLGELLSKLHPTFDLCSLQINFDSSLIPTEEDKIRFLKLYAMYEDIIYRFSKGNDEYYRYSLNIYASPIILSLKDGLNIKDNEYLLEKFTDQKRYGISLKKEQGLVEFRTPNATTNPILIQNYITTFYYLLVAATNKKINQKRIDEYIDRFSKIYLLESYERRNDEKALEFANLIFNSQLDKIYFLHQYNGIKKEYKI